MPLLGIFAALAATILWAYSTVLWKPVLERHGPFTCNLFKATAGVLLTAVCLIPLLVFGTPVSLTQGAAALLMFSGAIGMAVGDFAFFSSMAACGPTRTSLLHSTSPLFLLFLTLGLGTESLSTAKVVGVLLIFLGVADVTWTQRRNGEPTSSRRFATGVAWGMFSAVCQALGVFLTRQASGETHFLILSFFRLAGAALALWMATRLPGHRASWDILVVPSLRPAWMPVLLGTFLGVALMMVAIAEAGAAVAGAVLSLTPISVLPIAAWRLREPLSLRLLLGISLALSGIITLTLA